MLIQLTTAQKKEDRIMLALLRLSAFLAVAILVFIVGYIMVQGFPVLNLGFLLSSAHQDGTRRRHLPSIVGTVVLTLLSAAIATPPWVWEQLFFLPNTPVKEHSPR